MEGWGFWVHLYYLYGVEQTGSLQGMLWNINETEKYKGIKAYQIDNFQIISTDWDNSRYRAPGAN